MSVKAPPAAPTAWSALRAVGRMYLFLPQREPSLGSLSVSSALFAVLFASLLVIKDSIESVLANGAVCLGLVVVGAMFAHAGCLSAAFRREALSVWNLMLLGVVTAFVVMAASVVLHLSAPRTLFGLWAGAATAVAMARERKRLEARFDSE